MTSLINWPRWKLKGPLYNSTLNPIKLWFIQNQFYAFDCDGSRVCADVTGTLQLQHRSMVTQQDLTTMTSLMNSRLDFERNYCYFVNYTKKCSLCSGHCTWFPIFSYTLPARSLANRSGPGCVKHFAAEFFSKNRRNWHKERNRRIDVIILRLKLSHWMVNLADGSIREIFFCICESRDWNVERENPKNHFSISSRVPRRFCTSGIALESLNAICVEGEIYIRSWSRDRHQKLFPNSTFSYLHSRHHFCGQ